MPHEHEGAAFVEIYQNCNVFNDGAFEGITVKESRRRCRSTSPTVSRSASATTSRRASCSTSSASASWSRSPTSAQTSSSCTTSTATIPTPCVRVVPHRRSTDDADAHRRVPRCGPSGLRGCRCSTSWLPRRSARDPATWPSCSTRRGLTVEQRATLIGRRVSRRERGTRDRCAAWAQRTWSSAASARPGGRRRWIWATLTGRSRNAASASPRVMMAATVAASGR